MIGPEEVAETVTPIPVWFSTAKCNFTAGASPTAADDRTEGYDYNSRWYVAVYPYSWWVCVDPTDGAAVWKDVPLALVPQHVTAIALEAISPGHLVNLWNDGGVLKARKANATDNTKPCDGFNTGVSWSISETATIFTQQGITIPGLSGLTIGQQLFLSTTGGGVTATAPSGTGKVVQAVGKALSTTTAVFAPGPPIKLR